MALHIVTGSPGCGKSTWVRNNAKPGDIQIGSDELTNTLTGKAESKHHHDPIAKKISKAAREAAIQEAIKHRHHIDIWILVSNLTEDKTTQWRKHGARFIVIDPGYDTALQRCKAHRPGYKHKLVDSWYAKRDQWPHDAEIIDPGELDSPGQYSAPPAKDKVKRGSVAVHVVTGPPAAGKSTYVRDRRQSGDVTIDYDTIANELSGLEPANHGHTQHIKQITKKARQAAIDAAISMDGDHTVWIIHSSPSDKLLDHYRALGAVIDVVDPGKEVVMKRCKAERPPEMLKIAAAWYGKQKQKPVKPLTNEQRGLGRDHRIQREKLIRQHRDGAPCWWCGMPMHGDRRKQSNWDGKALAADHTHARAAGGTRADRLLHFTCNSQRQDGRNDHLRPTVTGLPPGTPIKSAQVNATASGFQFGGITFTE